MANIKFFTGAKENIDAKVTEGVIDEGDIILTSDTDELVFINPQKEKKIISTKSQQQHELKNDNLGAMKTGDIIEKGISFDEFLEKVTGETAQIPAATLVMDRTGGDAAGLVNFGDTVSVDLNLTLTREVDSVLGDVQILVNDVPAQTVTLGEDGTAAVTVSFTADENIDYTVKAKAVVDGVDVFAETELVYSTTLYVINEYYEEMPDLSTIDFDTLGGDVVDHGDDSAYPFISEGYKVSILAVKAPYEIEAIIHQTMRVDITEFYTFQTIGEYQVGVYEMDTKTPVPISLRVVLYRDTDGVTGEDGE